MSRLAKKPIEVPAGVTFTATDGWYQVKGPQGELKKAAVPHVQVKAEEQSLRVNVAHPDRGQDRAYWGTATRVIENMIIGVTAGFRKQLEINGVGFKAEVKGKNLVLNVGFSHAVEFPEIPGITITVEKNIITVAGIDKELVGQVAANIRKVRPPEPYKGKGIKYVDEVVRRKEGKQVKTTS